MKQFKRYLSVLLCCLSLSIVFSSIVRADEIILEDYQVNINNSFTTTKDGNTKTYQASTIIINPYNGVQEKTSFTSPTAWFWSVGTSGKITTQWIFSNGRQIMHQDDDYTININNCYYNVGVDRTDGLSSIYLSPMTVKGLLYYTDNTTEYVDIEWKYSNHTLNMSLTHTPRSDVTSFEIIITTSLTGGTEWRYFDNVGEFITDKSFEVVIEKQSEEAGLLGGIIEWVKNIFNKITEMGESISNIFSKLGDIGQTLLNLPSMIWNFISDGLKSLFVPSDEYFETYKTSMAHLMLEKFGAVYEVSMLMLESWDRIQANDDTNTILFPEVTIPLPNGNEFTFGGQEVNIVPIGFDWLATSLKMLVGIVCTLMFINGLKGRYEEIMGGR